MRFKKINKTFLLAFVIVFFVFILPTVLPVFLPAVLPMTVSAQEQPKQPSGAGGLIPCDGPDCNFDSLLLLAKNLMAAVIIVLVTYTAIGFAWAGYLFMSAGGDVSKITWAKSVFVKLIWGFIFILSAWIIVRTITYVLLEPANYTDLLKKTQP